MGRKRVAVSGSDRGSRIAWTLSRLLLKAAGVEPFFVSAEKMDERMIANMEGLLLLGGVDIDPSTYGGPPHEKIGKTEPARDRMEWRLLEAAKRRGLAVMGICRGMQMIDLFEGGTLHPHLHDLKLSAPHPHTPLPVRKIRIEPQTRLHRIVGTSTLKVNALHHQAVDRLGEGLRVAARDENGIVQAIESVEGPFTIGVQWHPEFMPYAWHSRKIFAAFAAAVKGS